MIPAELERLTKLRDLRLRRNRLTGEFSVELAELDRLSLLALDNNELTGPIPPEIGRMTKLTHLLLEHNRLTGTIPDGLTPPNLDVLNLSYNMISGEIPPGVIQLSNLVELTVAGNQLTGCATAGLPIGRERNVGQPDHLTCLEPIHSRACEAGVADARAANESGPGPGLPHVIGAEDCHRKRGLVELEH